MPNDSPALLVESLRKRYGDRDVVAGLSLRAARGELTAVLGPNGAGKTTSIECCEGLRRPDGGRIEVLGLDRSRPEAAAPLRHRVGVMLQEGGLPMAPRAGAVLGHVARLHDRPAAARPLLARLGLENVARTRVRRLSGGQRQRLALACAIVGEPELVFLDEPTAGLDPQARLAVWDLLRELRETGTSMVLTTHLMTEAEELADHVVVVDAGTVVAAGSPAELRGATHVRIIVPSGTAPQALAADLGRALATDPRLETALDRGTVVVRARAAAPTTEPAGLATEPTRSATASAGSATAAARPTQAAQRATAAAPAATEAARAATEAARAATERARSAAAPAPTTQREDLDAAALAVVAGALDAAGHSGAEIALTRPTLEDAFLALTGRELRVDAA